MDTKRSALSRSYRNFASAFGTAWLIVIVLAIFTGGQIGRWGGVILPLQFFGSLAYAIVRNRRRKLRQRRRESQVLEGIRFVPI